MIAALSFLTVVGSGVTPDARAMKWFGPVGAAIGAVLGAIWWGASELFNPLLAATIVVAADAAITGMLHLDGLADSGDGLLPHLPRDRRLAIMRDPTIGAFGVIVVVLTLLLRVAALSTQVVSIPLLAAVWAASRSAMTVIALCVPYARPHGIASMFLGEGRRLALGASILTIAAAAGAAFLVDGVRGAVAVGVALAGSAAVTALARHRLGGFTGDTLGASGVVAETVGLVAAAGRWN